MSILQTTLYDLLGGSTVLDKKNNVLKSLFITNVDQFGVEIEAEPYDDAYNTNHIDQTMEKVVRIINRRESAIFKALQHEYGENICHISITFFDDMTVCGGCTKYQYVDAKVNY